MELMLYRSRKRLLQGIKYLLTIGVTLVLYMVFAHKMWLPAIFEKYTGEMVRANTIGLYSQIHFLQTVEEDDDGGLHRQIQYRSLTKWDILDIITRQSDYLFTVDILRSYNNSPVDIENIKKSVFNITTHTGLIEWLKNEKGQYAEIFKYEFLRYLETFKGFKQITIINEDGSVLYSSDTGEKVLEKPVENMEVKNNNLLNKVYSGEKYIGYIQVAMSAMNQNEDLNLPEMPFGMTNIILNNESYVDQTRAGEQDLGELPYVVKGKYVGIRSGVVNKTRVLSGRFGQGSVVIMYPRASIFSYVFKIFLYILLIATIGVTIYSFNKYKTHLNRWFYSSIKGMTEREILLEQAINMQNSSVEFSKECSQKLIELKENEIHKIAALGEHLSYLHSKVEENSKNNLLNDSV